MNGSVRFLMVPTTTNLNCPVPVPTAIIAAPVSFRFRFIPVPVHSGSFIPQTVLALWGSGVFKGW